MGGLNTKKPLAVTSGSESAWEARFHSEIIAQNEGLFFTPVNGKRPYQSGWQNNPLSCSDALLEVARGNATGIGLVHAHSGTCSLDIDQLDKSKELLAKHGIDLEALLEDPSMFRIHSPKENSEKLLFRTHGWQPRSTTQIKDDDGTMVLELRCGGAQDVWPGSDYQYTSGEKDRLFEGQYEHGGSKVIPQLPEKFVALWEAEATKKPTFIAQEGEDEVYEDDVTLAIAKARLLKVKPAVTGQGGNDHTYETALEMRDLGLSQEITFRLMLDKFNPRCKPPWQDGELIRIVRSAYKNAKNPQGCGNTRAAFRKAGVGGEGYTPGVQDGAENGGLQELVTYPDGTSERGAPLATTPNVECMFTLKGVQLSMNDMSHEIEVVGIPLYSDSAENDIISWAQDEAIRNGMAITRIPSILATIASKHRYHPFDQELNRTPVWDGVNRIKELTRTLKTKHDDDLEYFNTSVMMMIRWLVSIVAAVRRPNGSKPLRIVLVLAGPQYIGKTTFFKTIMSDSSYFKEGGHLDPADKDSVIQNTQHLVNELGEIDATFAKKDVSRLKAFIGRDVDHIRLPYDKGVSKYKRQTVYCGTVNDPSFLTDQTGNSRFAVIDLISIDQDGLNQIDRPQLWAQILHLYNAGEPWNFSKEELVLVNSRNEQHTERPYIESIVVEKFNWDAPRGRWQWLSITEIVDHLELKDVLVRNSRNRKDFVSALMKLTESKTDSRRRTTTYLVPPPLFPTPHWGASQQHASDVE